MFFNLESREAKIKEVDIGSEYQDKSRLTMFLGRRFSIDVKLSFILESMFGFSRWLIERVFCRFSLSFNVKVFSLSDIFIARLETGIINSYSLRFGRNLRNFVKHRLERFIELKIYKGLRFLQSLPMRGQRTKTNGRTMKRRSLKVFSALNISKKVS